MRLAAHFFRWWCAPTRALPRSRVGILLRLGASIVAIAWATRRAIVLFTPLTQGVPPPPIPADVPGARFGVPDDVRHEVFTEMAAAEIDARIRGVGGFGGHVWSIEDQRASLERYAAHAIAARRKLSLTQVYLILDEGIRGHWPGPDGKPLAATTPPLDPRRK